MKVIFSYYLIISIGMIGMISVLIWTIQGKESILQWIAALISMLLILLGVIALATERGGRK